MYKGMKNMIVVGSVAVVLAVCVYLLTRIYQQCLVEYHEEVIKACSKLVFTLAVEPI